MNFDIDSSFHAANNPEDPAQHSEGASCDAIDQLPETTQIVSRSAPNVERSCSHLAQLTMGSLAANENAALNGELKAAAETASAFAIVLASRSILSKGTKEPKAPKEVRFNEVLPQREARACIPINLMADDAASVENYILYNKDKSYHYKTLALLQSLEQHSNSNLSVDEVVAIKSRLDLIGKIKRYKSEDRKDLPRPTQLPWPPVMHLNPHKVITVPTLIARVYSNIYHDILTSLLAQYSSAEGKLDHIKSAEIEHLLNDINKFPFQELMIYAVLTNHDKFIRKVIPDFNDKSVTCIKELLALNKITPIDVMKEYGLESWNRVSKPVDNLLILYSLERTKDIEGTVKRLKLLFESGGNALARSKALARNNESSQSLLTAYSRSDFRNPNVMDALFLGAIEQLDSLLEKIDITDAKQVHTLIEYFQNYSQATRLPESHAHALQLRIAALQTKCRRANLSLPEEALHKLVDAELRCEKITGTSLS